MKANDGEVADRAIPAKTEKIRKTWMYDWMDDLKDFDDWKNSIENENDLGQLFAFRESKIYTLKRVRDRLHRIQTTMVKF